MTSMVPPRQPPRFVPTLTDVVEVATPAAPVMPEPSAVPVAASAPSDLAAPEQTVHVPAEAEELPDIQASTVAVVLDNPEATEALRARVMARVQDNLQERLHATLTEVVQQLQTQTLYKILRAEIDAMVVNAVQEAVAQELERLKQRS